MAKHRPPFFAPAGPALEWYARVFGRVYGPFESAVEAWDKARELDAPSNGPPPGTMVWPQRKS